MATKTNSNKTDSIDFKEINSKLRGLVIEGRMIFPQLTEAAQAASKYPSERPVCTIVFTKSNPDHDEFARIANWAHKEVGGKGDIVRDGDSEELRKHNAGCFVAKVKFGPYADPVDTDAETIEWSDFSMGDTVRCSATLFDYTDGKRLFGCSLWGDYLMLCVKAPKRIPTYGGSGGYKKTNKPTQAATEADDGDGDDVPFDGGTRTGPAAAPRDGGESMTDRLLRQAREARARREAA